MLAAVLTLPVGIAAGANNPMQVIAGPGAASSNYLTTRVVHLRGRTLKFKNYDLAAHDVWSSIPGQFWSPRVGLNKATTIFGVENLPNGNYKFYCTLHPRMKGQILVR